MKLHIETLPILICGDFNALTETDYTTSQWQEITKVRSDNAWEKPKSDVTNAIKSAGFYDTLECNEIVNIKNEMKKGGLKTLGTCRFDTRIDYMFVNKYWLKHFKIINYQHLRHNDTSDHKLVRLSFQLNQTNPEN